MSDEQRIADLERQVKALSEALLTVANGGVLEAGASPARSYPPGPKLKGAPRAVAILKDAGLLSDEAPAT